jgi:hypothetical protein
MPNPISSKIVTTNQPAGIGQSNRRPQVWEAAETRSPDEFGDNLPSRADFPRQF